MRLFFHLCFCLLCALCVSVVNPASGAPPTITYLYPAGAQRGTTAEITAAGTFDKWPVKVWAGGKGVTVEPGKDKGKLSATVAADAVPGVYWLRAYNDDSASTLRPFIVGTLPEVTEKEPNDEVGKAQVIDRPAVVNGRLDKSGDVDCFAVALRKGQTLVASLDAHHTLRSPMDGVLQILSADGFVLDQNNDFRGLDPQLAFTAPKDGTYVARVFAFPATPDSSIRFAGAETYVYRLTLTTSGFADYTMPLAVPRADPGEVEVVGWDVPDAAKRLRVPAAAAEDETAAVFHSALANPLRVKLEPHPCFRGPLDRSLAPPFSVTGLLEKPGAAGSYPVAVKKGQALAVQVRSSSFGLPVAPVVRILGADGQQLARGEPAKLGGETAVSFTPPADGTVTAEVRDLYAAGGPRSAYLLRVAPPEPDYELSVAADRFAVPPGKSVSIPVKVARKNGFTKPVGVTAEGLPDGLKLETATPAKPDPNTVTLTLTAEKPASGAFRLVGRVRDEPGFTRTARAALPEFDETTADLWASVTDKPVGQPPKKKKKN
jgi:hypothetical protein